MKLITKPLFAFALANLMIVASGCATGTNSLNTDKVVLTSIDGIQSNEVRVEIADGVAVINGQVYDRYDIWMATEAVAEIDGVDRVINRLQGVGLALRK